jgi:hypothetical protein
MRSGVDINVVIDQQELDEERDNRRFGNNDFDYLEELKIIDEEESAW